MRERKRTELGIGAGDFVLVSAGRLEANKNNGTLIRALHKAAHKNIRLLLCGEGEARDALADLAASLGVVDRVIFAGNRRDMPDIYHAVDALALASHREGLSRTVMEAMACGLPCVVSGIRGNVDLSRTAKTALSAMRTTPPPMPRRWTHWRRTATFAAPLAHTIAKRCATLPSRWSRRGLPRSTARYF